jgi:hypothetical protein
MPLSDRIPTAGIAAVVLIVLSEAIFLTQVEPLSGWPVFELTADDALYLAKRPLIEKSAGQVVLIGDSSCMMDLMPSEIEPQVGVSVINLGMILNMSPAGFADIGAEAGEQNPPPRAVVLAVLPQVFEVSEAQTAEWDQLGRYLLAYGRTSPLYTPGLRDYWSWFFRKHRVNIFPPEWGRDFPTFAEKLRRDNGFTAEKKKYTGTTAVRDEFRPTPFARSAIHYLVQRTKDRGIPVVIWLNPVPDDSVTSTYKAGMDQFLRELRRDEPDLIVLQTGMPLLSGDRFGTVTHLNPVAAQAHSKEFGGALRSALATRRDSTR